MTEQPTAEIIPLHPDRNAEIRASLPDDIKDIRDRLIQLADSHNMLMFIAWKDDKGEYDLEATQACFDEGLEDVAMACEAVKYRIEHAEMVIEVDLDSEE